MGKSKVEQDKHTDRRPGARPASTGYPIHSVPWQEIGDALEVIAPIGGALRIVLTRDGGALAIGVGGLGFLASALCFSRRSLAGTPWSQPCSTP